MSTSKTRRPFPPIFSSRSNSSFGTLAVLAMGTCLLSGGHAYAQGLQLTYGSKGVQTLSYNGVSLENVAYFPSDAFHIWHMKATDLSGNILSSGQYGWGESNNGSNWNSQTNTETYSFTWGTIATQFVQNGNTLNIVVTETNYGSSGILLDGAEIYPLALHFPKDPAGFNGYTQYAITTTDPGVSVADFGSGVVTSVIPDESSPLYGGWKSAGTATYTPLMTSTAPDGLATFLPHNDRSVQPGTSFSYTVSLRFTPEGSTASTADAYASFAATYPSQMTWADKRIIGTAWLASSPSGGDDTQPGGFPTNPRRYFNDSGTDVTTAAGLQTFQNRMLAQAASTAANATNMNAQAVITWDLEGEQYPQTTSYVCSPNLIATVAPEMESTITDPRSAFVGQKLDDAYFKTMTNAGLKIGLCLRPQVFTLGANGTASQVSLTTNAAIIANLENKARYANSRWGATVFYVDSTVNPDGGTLDPAIFQQVITDLPSLLFIPEESTTRYYAYTAPFYSFIFHTTTGTAPAVYSAYPNAFGANLVNDVSSSTLATYLPQLTGAVVKGDILMGHADYWQANDPTLASIYAAAGVHAPTLTTPTLTWPTPAAMTYGAPLTSAQLDASASVAGSFTYSPAAGTILPAGSSTVTVNFTPTNTRSYKTTSTSVLINVAQATPILSWNLPAAFTTGTALSSTQLNATASVPGTFTYSPAAGTVLPAGTTTLAVAFNPTGTPNYKAVSSTVALIVNPVPVAVTPAPVTTPVAAIVPNMVKDPGFELQTSNTLSSPWSITGSAPHGVDRLIGNAHSGVNNAYIWDNGGDWNAMQQTVAVQPNTEYVYSVWVHSSLVGQPGYLSVLGATGIVNEASFGNLPQYSLLTVKFNSGANTAVALRIGFWGQNTVQWVQVDDVALRTNLLLDPGFELQSSRTLSTPWTQSGAAPTGIDIGLGYAHNGNNEGYIWSNTSASNALTQAVAVQPNTTYSLTAWVRSSLLSGTGSLFATGSTGILNSTTFAALPSYAQLTLTFNSGVNTSVQVGAGLTGANGVQWVQLDDLTLQPTQ